MLFRKGKFDGIGWVDEVHIWGRGEVMTQTRYFTLEEVLAARPVNRRRVDRERAKIRSVLRAQRLADIRAARNLTQRNVAEAIDVDQSRISRIENGDLTRVEVGTLMAYAEALGGTLEISVRVQNVAIPLSLDPK